MHLVWRCKLAGHTIQSQGAAGKLAHEGGGGGGAAAGAGQAQHGMPATWTPACLRCNLHSLTRPTRSGAQHRQRRQVLLHALPALARHHSCCPGSPHRMTSSSSPPGTPPTTTGPPPHTPTHRSRPGRASRSALSRTYVGTRCCTFHSKSGRRSAPLDSQSQPCRSERGGGGAPVGALLEWGARSVPALRKGKELWVEERGKD